MAYTPVPAVAAGDWIDEVFINTYWVDNMAAGLPDAFTAKGQLPIGLGVDSMGILAVGANGTVLTADSAEATGIKWSELAFKRTTVSKSSSQTIAYAVPAVITFNTEAVDDEGLHSTVTNTERITFVQDGYYLLVANIYVATNVNTVSIRKNGSSLMDFAPHVNGTTAYPFVLPVSVLAGDYIDLYTSAQTGGYSVGVGSTLTVIRLGA